MSPKNAKGGRDKAVKSSKSNHAARDDPGEEAKKNNDSKKETRVGLTHDRHEDENAECKTTWNQLIGAGNVEKTLQTKFEKFSAEQLDFDFFTYASKVYTQLAKRQLSRKHDEIATRWLTKLMTDHYPDQQSKKTRNIYFMYLLHQMMDGALAGPLLKSPPPGPLPSATVAFQLSAPTDHSRLENVKDIMLDAKSYLHTSTDGRLYMATKSLEGGHGACAYIGMSVGGDEPEWIKPSGEVTKVPEREDLAVLEIEGRGDQAFFRGVHPGQSVHAIASKRKSKADRQGLINFYEEVLAKIRAAKKEENVAYDGPQDTLLQKLLHNIRCEAKSQGASDNECGFMILLPALEMKIASMLKEAKIRDRTIEQITVDTNVMDNDPKLVDMASMIAMDPADDIWKAAVREEPSADVINQLNHNYPPCLVTALLMLLERQRQIIIEQEKKCHEQLVASMKAEMLNEIKDGVTGYKAAQKMYNGLTNALKQAEKALTARRDKGAAGTSEMPSVQAKQVVGRQLAEAERRLEASRKCARDIDDKMEEMACRIADVQERNKDAKNMLQNDARRWSEHICRMKEDLKAQERQISNMHGTLDNLQRQEPCLY